MNPKDVVPRFALVIWPDAPAEHPPSCITLDAVDQAVARGAMVIAREPEAVVTFEIENGED